MLTEEQYKELVRYRSGDILDDGVLTETKRFLYRKKYIIRYQPMRSDGSYSISVMCAITEPGREALAEFEEYTEQERNNRTREEAKQEIQRLQVAADRRKQFKRDIVVAIIGSAVGGLIVLAVQNWPSIVSFFAILFQKIPSP